jgi:hypothetical protein
MKAVHNRRHDWLCLPLIALLVATQAQAQGQPQAQTPPQWLDVVIVQVKSGMGPDFEDRVKELQAARRSANLPVMQVFSVVRGHPNEYHLVTPVQSLAAANAERDPMGPADRATWLARITSTVDSVRFFYARTYPQHAVQGAQGGPTPQLLLLRTTHVYQGKQDDYENWIANQYMPAFRQTKPLGHTMSQGAFGDSDQNFYHATPVADWATLDHPDPLVTLLGQKRMDQMVAALEGIVESSGVIVARIRTDLMGGAN